MDGAKTFPLALLSVLFLGVTALLRVTANGQLLEPANAHIQSFPVGQGPTRKL